MTKKESSFNTIHQLRSHSNRQHGINKRKKISRVKGGDD
uniref:Uncharacterized protein n=1 Tax=Arundo donax TaxID=35708 RepID=A0A0A8XPT4_ARUDO